MVPRLRRGHHQRAAASGDGKPVRRRQLIAKMKRGAYLVNTARGKICRSRRGRPRTRERPARGLCRRRLVPTAGTQGPSLADDAAPRHDTAHLGHHRLSAQARYAAGTREILECWFEGKPIREEYLIVDGGKLAGTGAHSYSAGDATRGSEEAARFKT